MGGLCSKDDSAESKGSRSGKNKKYADDKVDDTQPQNGTRSGGDDGAVEELHFADPGENNAPDFQKFPQLLPEDTAAMCVVAGPFPNTCVVGGEDKKLHYVNYTEGRKISQSFKAHEKDINKMVYHQGTDRLYTASRDALVKSWSLGADNGGEGELSTEAIMTFQGNRLNVTGVSVSADGQRLVTGSRDNSTRLWDTTTGDLLHTQDIKLNVVHWVEWMEELGCVAQGGEDLTVRLYDFRAGGARRETIELSATLGNFDYHPICVTKHCNNPNVIYTGHNGFNMRGSMVTEWDLRMQKQVQHWQGKHSNTVRRVHHSSTLKGFDGRQVLVSTSDDETMICWDPTVPAATEDVNQKVIMQYRIPEGRVTGLYETPNFWTVPGSGGDLLLSLRSGAVLSTSFEEPLKKGAAPPRLLRHSAFAE